jgi:hypothetical protein
MPRALGDVTVTSARLDRTDRVRPEPDFHLRAGGVLHRSFRIWGTNLFGLSVLGLLISSPALAAWALIAFFGGDDPEVRNLWSSLVRLLWLILNTIILQGAVTYSVLGQLGGSPPPIAAALRTGLARASAVLGAGLLAGLAMLAAGACLIVPGLVLATWYWVVIPVAVIESPGSRTALTRSQQLTKGNRWPIFACMMALGIVSVGGAAAIEAAVRAVGGPEVVEAVTRMGSSSSQLTADAQALVGLLSIPLAVLGPVGPTVAYHDLRVGKERTSLDEMLDGFDL